MADNKFSLGQSCGRETVAIETNRIFDCCRDRDCFENARVFLTEMGSEIIEHTSNIRVSEASIAWTYISTDSVQFNRGFYSVDIRFYVKVKLEACLGPGNLQCFDGIAVLDKRVILYGGESNVNTFRSSCDTSFCSVPEPCNREKNVPDVTVEVLDPVVLGVKVLEHKSNCCCCCCCADIPENVQSRVDGCLTDNCEKYLGISLGLFSVIRMLRPAQYLISATEYSVPDKECVQPDAENPCGSFRAMPFPISEFSTQTLHDKYKQDRGTGCGCGCNNNN